MIKKENHLKIHKILLKKLNNNNNKIKILDSQKKLKLNSENKLNKEKYQERINDFI